MCTSTVALVAALPWQSATAIADSTVARSGIGTSLSLVAAQPDPFGVGVGVAVGVDVGVAVAVGVGVAVAVGVAVGVGVGVGVPAVSTVTCCVEDHGPAPVRLIARALSQCAPSLRCS